MPVTLTLTLHDNGQLEISGPIDNPIICFGLLEAGKDAVRQHKAKPKQLVAPVSVIPTLSPNGQRG